MKQSTSTSSETRNTGILGGVWEPKNPPLSVEEHQEKVCWLALDLSGLNKWLEEKVTHAHELLREYHDIFLPQWQQVRVALVRSNIVLRWLMMNPFKEWFQGVSCHHCWRKSGTYVKWHVTGGGLFDLVSSPLVQCGCPSSGRRMVGLHFLYRLQEVKTREPRKIATLFLTSRRPWKAWRGSPYIFYFLISSQVSGR